MRLDGNYFASSRIGVRRSDQVHGPNVRPKLEVEASHEPERRTPMRLDGNYFASSRIGVRRSCKVHGPNVRPKLEVKAPSEASSHEPRPARGWTSGCHPCFPLASRLILSR